MIGFEGLDFSEVALLVPVIVYLFAVVGFVAKTGKCPSQVHALSAIAGVVSIGVTVGFSGLVGWVPNIVVFLLLMGPILLVAGNLMTGLTFFTFAVAVLLTPYQDWWAIGLGLVFAVLVAIFRVVTVLGRERLWFLSMETLESMGINPAGGFRKPNPRNVPSKVSLKDVEVEENKRLRIVFPNYMLFGFLTYAAFQIF